MKRKILLTFLLFLYICPTILYLSYGPSAIAKAPNMNKDFSLATYGDESPESITSFSETLPDDVLFYPDVFTNNMPVHASAGSAGIDSETGDYTDTWSNLMTQYEGISGDGNPEAYVILNFTLPDIGQVEYFEYAINNAGQNDDDDCNIWAWDWTSNDWGLLNATGWLGVFAWTNGSSSNPDFITGTVLMVKVNSTDSDNAMDVGVALAEITYYVMTLADSEHYAESFASVDDWSGYGTEGDDAVISDGDIGTFKFDDNDNADYWQTSLSLGVITNHYIEFRIKYNVSGSIASYNLLKNGLLGAGGSVSQTGTIGGGTANTWYTRKLLVTSTDSITGFAIYFSDPNYDYSLSFDYLRIAPSTEMGWQHDGSTTAGVDDSGTANVDFTSASDGDILTLTITGAAGCSNQNPFFKIDFDDTATGIDIERDYYPFTHVKYKLNSFSGCGVYLRMYAEGYRSEKTIYTGATGVWLDWRNNIKAETTTSTYMYGFMLYGYDIDEGDSLSVLVDFVQMYSIANFTVTQSGVCDTDDYLYVDDGVLWSGGGLTYPEYITLNHDPALSVATATYSVWNITSNFDNPTSNEDLYFYATVGGVETQEGNDETRGTYSNTGTLTDCRFGFKYTGLSVSAIKFIDTRMWRDSNDATIILQVPMSEGTAWALNNLYILLGMGMVIVSGVYLAKGGRNELSMDKFFFVVIAFVIGWALIIGGVMP